MNNVGTVTKKNDRYLQPCKKTRGKTAETKQVAVYIIDLYGCVSYCVVFVTKSLLA